MGWVCAQKIIRAALGLARLPRLGRLVGWGFARMSQFLPLHRLRQTPSFLAFYHPQPIYPVYILIVPRRPVAGLDALHPDDREFYQDFPQLHFRLVSGDALKPG